MDRYRIDGQKLHYHLPRVADWAAGKTIYPIYMELSPMGACNHRCTFCGVDFMGYESRRLDADLLCARLEELGRLGLRSAMYAGEGEPLLHPEIARIIETTKKAGIDAAVTTNGTALKRALAERILPHTEWIKVSLNAGSAETYAAVHGTKAGDFDRVFRNLSDAVAVRREGGHKCTLGAQIVLLPENRHEVVQLARLCREVGLDYLVVKPYSQHTQSITVRYKHLSYEDDVRALQEDLSAENGDGFEVVLRVNAMARGAEVEKPYKSCQSLPFWSYVDAGGNVWGCSVYLKDPRFFYGNLSEESFEAIWNGERRRESLRFVEEELDISGCRKNCRMDAINRYLWDLKHPPEHLNFI